LDIHQILIRYIEGNATPEQKRDIILWLDESPEHMREYVLLRKLNNLSVWNTERSKERDILKEKKVYFIRNSIWQLLKVACVFFIGVLSTYLFFISNDEDSVQMQTIYVPPGQRTELFLSDGTEVWLNSGTTFSFPDHFAKQTRTVHLDGEGYFKVSNNTEWPFVINTKKYDVKVLGTEFNIKSYDKRGVFETSLLEGSVEIFSDENKEILRLKPTELAYETTEGLIKTSIDDYNYFKWREGLICFEKENVASLFAKLELYYDIRIDVRNKSLMNYTYTGKFRVRDGVEHVLRVLQVKHQFTYTKYEDNNLYVIE